MGVGGAERISFNLISRLILMSDPLYLFFCPLLVNVCGVSVCYFTVFDLADRGVNVCSFTGLNLAGCGVIVFSFTFPDLSERGVNEVSFSRLSVQADIGVHDFSFY